MGCVDCHGDIVDAASPHRKTEARKPDCAECHGSHGILPVDDPKSKVHPDNKLKTRRQCHNGKKPPLASEGFVTFYPHADDYGRHSQVWIASRLMGGLMLGVFGFFWLHSGLWYYREWRNRRSGKPAPHVQDAALGTAGTCSSGSSAAAQYNGLVAAGELERYLVDRPSRPMTLGSKSLGLVPIGIGLALLVLVGIGFFDDM